MEQPTDSDTRLPQAVALRYDPKRDAAPEVVAKGRGLIAEAIVARAREAGVFVHESPQLVQLLMAVDLDSQIPPALYTAVAELLAWLWRLDAAGDATPEMPK
jgi:flagellar biosynthesis protein